MLKHKFYCVICDSIFFIIIIYNYVLNKYNNNLKPTLNA